MAITTDKKLTDLVNEYNKILNDKLFDHLLYKKWFEYNPTYSRIYSKHSSQIIMDDVEIPRLVLNKNKKLLLLED